MADQQAHRSYDDFGVWAHNWRHWAMRYSVRTTEDLLDWRYVVVELIGRKNDVDIADIMTGVDAMIAGGSLTRSLGVMGWSNGGYLTNCLVAHPVHGKRFKAASSGAGVFDTAMQWMIGTLRS